MNNFILEYNKGKNIMPNTLFIYKDLDNNTEILFSKNKLTNGVKLPYNQKLCDELFEIDDKFYLYFPIVFKSDEMTRKMIKKYYHRYYPYYPDKYKTYELSMEYVNHRNSHMQYVPLSIITQEMCDRYIMHEGNIAEIPRKFIYMWYFKEIAKKYHLGTIPVEYRSIDVCRIFLDQSINNIIFVSKNNLKALCEEYNINYDKNILLDKNDYWMQVKVKKRVK